MDKVVAIIREVLLIKTMVPDLKQMDAPTTQALTSSNNLSNPVAPTTQAHNLITSRSLNHLVLAANHELLIVSPSITSLTAPL